MTRTHKQSTQAVADTIAEIGVKKTTDKKIAAACKRYNVDENRVRKVAGFDKGGVNEYQITRL